MAKTLKERFNKYYCTIKGRAAHMHNNARQRAKRNGIEMTITREWLEEKLTAGVCDVTGLPFVLQENDGKGHHFNSFSPSIDRIAQDGPYSPDNCQVTCWIYNRAKGAFPLKDLRLMMDSIRD